MLKSIKIKLYPNQGQIIYINAAINIKKERIKIGMSLPELTPLESKSLDPRRIRKQKVELCDLI